MKKTLLILVLFITTLFSNVVNAQDDQQAGNLGKVREKMSTICIRSKVPVIYSSRGLTSAVVYITIDKWLYEPIKGIYKASVLDYIKDPKGYKVINSKVKFFTKSQVDLIFHTLNNSIAVSESYASEMDNLLESALLLETKTDLSSDGKTIYLVNPNDWEINN
jgi:hypothetical protein